MNKVSLQINLAPVDYRHALHILPHQLSVFSNQVDEILLTIDTREGKGRFAEGWHKNQPLFNDFIQQEIASKYPVTISPVDYSADIKQDVANYFFGTNTIPDRDFRGGPFYVYFFGLHRAKNNIVLHLDSDMLLGGGSQTWVTEAVQKLNKNSDCMFASPLPGPPHPDKLLVGQSSAQKKGPDEYSFATMSTRIFMIDKSKFDTHKLILQKPSFRNQLKALVEGNPPADLPEHLFSSYMQHHHLKRIDFLGSGKGLWSLHPPYRTSGFYEQLPSLLKRIAKNDLPQSQLGYYDIVDDVCDWAEARQKLAGKRWYKQLFKIK